MKYFTQIEAFFNKRMTGAEQAAFEHELVENTDLSEELDAYQTSVDLFDFTADNLSDEQILGIEAQNVPSNPEGVTPFFTRSRLVIFLAALVILLLFVFLGDSIQSQQEAAPVQPVEEKEQPVKEIPIAESSEGSSSKHEQLAAVVEMKESPTLDISQGQITEINKSSSDSPQTKPSKVRSDSKKVTKKSTKESPSPELTSNEFIDSGEKIVYQADKQITLTAGFHAKAGSNFRAMVKNN